MTEQSELTKIIFLKSMWLQLQISGNHFLFAQKQKKFAC